MKNVIDFNKIKSQKAPQPEPEWVDWLKSKEDYPKEEGYIVYQLTLWGNEKTFCCVIDPTDDDYQMMFNRGAPCCVSRYRIITEKEFLVATLPEFEQRISAAKMDLEINQRLLAKRKQRLRELDKTE